ncbi:hypothetical protein FRC98_06285 [Lujinxingia vulgaris]|uniref:Uncharacterized protein n=1 Tax=Lujinxingia vulgaris TaxID=2600176 RepID=A0A5C6XLJ5_9DELT|nr:hypothetical protein [Lujinxingia vulgaris]TXD38487.1 hypothetical protein FRC98_06285 [Lujinxingia vulgaris]
MRSAVAWVLAVGVVGLVQSFAGGAQAQVEPWAPTAETRARVTVVSLLTYEEDLEAAQAAAELLRSWSSVQVVDDYHGLPDISPEYRDEIITWAEAAEHAYFYEGAQAAAAMLDGRVQRMLDVPEAWGGDMDAAVFVRSAGLYLARALLDMGHKERAQHLIERLAYTFVARSILTRRWPPEVAEMWEVARQKLATYETTLTINVQDHWDCPVLVFGQKVGVSRLRVKPGQRYVFSADCGGETVLGEAAWSVGGFTPGEHSVGYWPSAHPGIHVGAEDMRSMANTRQVDEIVLLGTGDYCGPIESIKEGQACLWSATVDDEYNAVLIDFNDTQAAHRALGAVLPELYEAAGDPGRPDPVALSPAPSSPGPVAWAAPTTLMLAGGAWLGYTLMAQHRYNCSAQTGGDSWVSCESTQAMDFTSEEERLARSRSLNLHRLGAGITLGVGAAVLGALIIDGVGHDAHPQGSMSGFDVSVGPDGTTLGWGGRF